MTRQRDEMLDHEFDGIREYNNPPPRWIMMILYGSIVFGVGYWLYYHTYGVGSLPHKKLEAEMAVAAERQLVKLGGQELTDQTLSLMSQVPAQIAEGRTIFEQFCVQCHLANGSGSVGPNLTDNYWIHGGKPMQILNTVTTGVPDKGMVAWGSQLGPSRIQKVTAYLLTMKGKNVPGKAPQGQPEAEEQSAPAGQTPAAASPAGPGSPGQNPVTPNPARSEPAPGGSPAGGSQTSGTTS